MKKLELTESVIRKLEGKNDLYYCKVIDKAVGHKSKFVNYLAYEDNNVKFVYDINEATSLTKDEWNNLLDKLDLRNYRYGTRKISFIKASTSEESSFIVYYIPHRDWQGSWNLNQFKYELKRRGIPVIDITDDIQYHKYGNPEKYYEFHIPESYREQVEEFIINAQNMCDVSFKQPSY